MTPDELLATQQIRDTLSRYCRGLDRMDKELAYGVWSEGATADYVGMYEGTGRGFVDWVWESHAGMECHSHQVTNLLVEFGDEGATSEAYVTVVLWTKPGEGGRQDEIVVRGRYLDRWSQGERGWTIDHRVHVLDTQTVTRLGAPRGATPSARDRSDPSYAFLGRR